MERVSLNDIFPNREREAKITYFSLLNENPCALKNHQFPARIHMRQWPNEQMSGHFLYSFDLQYLSTNVQIKK